MPCASNKDVDVALGVVTDFTKQHPYTPAGTLRPRTRGELVRAVLTAEAAGKKAKAQGANFSLSSAQVSDGFVIDALRLDRHLSLPVPDTTGSLASDRIRGSGGQLAKLVRPGVSLGGKFLVHVEAGIRLKQLIEDLDGLGLALPTMGSRGALSLAGALATGTHGSDIDRPPLGDFVRAIHLVGPGGQEWWIEPSFGVVRAPDSSNHPDWCPDTMIVRDDDLFHAALVSVGRFGVIYSLVLEVEPQYWLHDQIEKRKWTAVREQLGSCAQSSSYDVPGVFLRSNGDRVRYYAVDLELAKQEHCWVGRRTVTDNHEDLGLGDAGGSTSFLCDDPKGLGAAVSFMKPLFLALEGQALAIPFAGLVWGPRITAFWIELQDTAHDSDTVGDFMARAFAKLAALPISEVGPFFHVEIRAILRDVVELMFSGEMTPERRGRSGRILDTHNYKSAHCLNGTSTEVFFNALQPQYLSFVDEVLEAARDDLIAGYMSLRYTRGSHALLAMQRWRISVAIEIAVARPTSGSNETFKAFFDKVLVLAKKWDGIPHWGQVHTHGANELAARYRDDLDAWRWGLAEIQNHGGETFDSAFCKQRGLEPTRDLDQYRALRNVGLIAPIFATAGE